jgi:hypothetical protein
MVGMRCMGPLGYKTYLHEGAPKGMSICCLVGHMCLGYSPLPHLYSANVLVVLLLASKRVETFVECFFLGQLQIGPQSTKVPSVCILTHVRVTS